MSGALRIVFTWLLAAALPLQGSAAASMTLCGTPGERPAVVRHVHEQGDASASTTKSASAHDSVQGHEGHHQAPGHSETAAKCSVCAACCASMAIAVADFALILVALSESLASPIGTGAPAFYTEGLERPPRTSSFA